MAVRRKKSSPTAPKIKGVIEGAGEVVEQKITNTLVENFMPHAMSVIMSRAIPEIDGFKPSHRKLLYTMYKMGLLSSGSSRTKSANIVGETMKLNPHGDSAIYDTMVRLSRGYEALLYPYVDSKGNFGKFYSRDMAWAASRYTEAKLSPICTDVFGDIEKNTVDFVDNYDNKMKEPTLLPVAYPSILVNSNTGIAVGMASNICPFNIAEVCNTTIELIKNPNFDVMTTLLAPDFPAGGLLVYDKEAIKQIYQTGRGGIKVRSRYTFDKENNCIDITQIPPTTTIEAIVEKIIDLVKQGKVKEISDIRDETDLNGLKITIDLKRGVDADRLMQRLFKMTTLQDTFSCNFNVLVNLFPKVMGVAEILKYWTEFRIGCVKRKVSFDLEKQKDKLHLLKGLEKILLDIDKAIKIVRETDDENDVVPNLMIGFGIDEIQADYVAEIKLRHLNKEYILKRTNEISELEKSILELEGILSDDKKVKKIIINQLKEIGQKYDQGRKTILYYPDENEQDDTEEKVDNYPVNLFFTKEGYFKKITPLSLRMGGAQKLKEDDKIVQTIESTNGADILFFTDKATVYKSKANDFEDTKASVLGKYIPTHLQMDSGENAIYMLPTQNYNGYLLFLFENGKLAKVNLSSFETKTNRKKLVSAYFDKAKLRSITHIQEDCDVLIKTSTGKIVIFNTAEVAPKATKATQGVNVITLKGKQTITSFELYTQGSYQKEQYYRAKSLPSTGFSLRKEDSDIEIGQLKLI